MVSKVHGGWKADEKHSQSRTFGGPLLAALNIFRDPLLVCLNFETPPTYLMATNQYMLQKSEEQVKQIKAKTKKTVSKEHDVLLSNTEKKARQAKPLESQLSH